MGVGLLDVFIPLILIDGVIILILGSDRYHFNLGQLLKILVGLTKWFFVMVVYEYQNNYLGHVTYNINYI